MLLSSKISAIYKEQLEIACSEFCEIIESGKILYTESGVPWKLRLMLFDGTFSKHFHDGSEMNVVESNLSDSPQEALRQFLRFVRSVLIQETKK